MSISFHKSVSLWFYISRTCFKDLNNIIVQKCGYSYPLNSTGYRQYYNFTAVYVMFGGDWSQVKKCYNRRSNPYKARSLQEIKYFASLMKTLHKYWIGASITSGQATWSVDFWTFISECTMCCQHILIVSRKAISINRRTFKFLKCAYLLWRS